MAIGISIPEVASQLAELLERVSTVRKLLF